MPNKTIAWIGSEKDITFQRAYQMEIEDNVPGVTFVEFNLADKALAGLLEEPYDLVVVNAWLSEGLNYPEIIPRRHDGNPREFSLDLVERVRRTSGPNQKTPIVAVSPSDFGSIPDQHGSSLGRSLIPEYKAAGVEHLVNTVKVMPDSFYQMVRKYLN